MGCKLDHARVSSSSADAAAAGTAMQIMPLAGAYPGYATGGAFASSGRVLQVAQIRKGMPVSVTV